MSFDPIYFFFTKKCGFCKRHKYWIVRIWGVLLVTRCSAIAERPRCRVRYSFGQRWKTETGRQHFTDIIGLASTTVIYSAWKSVEFGDENAICGLLRRSRSFKVIDIRTNGKPVCDFLLVINSYWHPISYHFGVIAAYCSNFGHFAFLSPLLGV